MNNITQNATRTVIDHGHGSQMFADELERLWLLSALRIGLDQVERGETVLADTAFFNMQQSRLFSANEGRVIEA